MSSTFPLRRVAGAHRQLLSKRIVTATVSATPSTCRRSHSTSEEPDPQLNGYPQLPWVSRQNLPAKGWQDMLLRRNFGDPLHEQEEVLSMWGPDAPPIDPHTATKQFLLAALGITGFAFLVKDVLTPEPPAVRREYPYDGLKQELGGVEENKARVQNTRFFGMAIFPDDDPRALTLHISFTGRSIGLVKPLYEPKETSTVLNFPFFIINTDTTHEITAV
ncbi:hypothetical protein AX16_009118 [Volvariella volvacea WC 439]|nr:hypothetical protein AX16_009118 [Volvariella volvacea WC 439]